MPRTITISDELADRITAFTPVVEAILEETPALEVYVEILMREGLDSMLADVVHPEDTASLLSFVQQLGAAHPNEVYGFLATTLRRGEDVQARERMRRRMGFHPPSEPPAR